MSTAFRGGLFCTERPHSNAGAATTNDVVLFKVTCYHGSSKYLSVFNDILRRDAAEVSARAQRLTELGTVGVGLGKIRVLHKARLSTSASHPTGALASVLGLYR